MGEKKILRDTTVSFIEIPELVSEGMIGHLGHYLLVLISSTCTKALGPHLSLLETCYLSAVR